MLASATDLRGIIYPRTTCSLEEPNMKESASRLASGDVIFLFLFTGLKPGEIPWTPSWIPLHSSPSHLNGPDPDEGS